MAIIDNANVLTWAQETADLWCEGVFVGIDIVVNEPTTLVFAVSSINNDTDQDEREGEHVIITTESPASFTAEGSSEWPWQLYSTAGIYCGYVSQQRLSQLAVSKPELYQRIIDYRASQDTRERLQLGVDPVFIALRAAMVNVLRQAEIDKFTLYEDSGDLTYDAEGICRVIGMVWEQNDVSYVLNQLEYQAREQLEETRD